MEKRDKLRDIRLIGSYGCAASVFAGKGIEECRQSLFKCNGVHVCSCLSHVSPTFSYSPETGKSRTPVKSGSDNMVLFSLYGANSTSCQGGDREGWFREAGLSAPLKGRLCIEEVGCTLVLWRPPYAGAVLERTTWARSSPWGVSAAPGKFESKGFVPRGLPCWVPSLCHQAQPSSLGIPSA